jgi:hypothetical protein
MAGMSRPSVPARRCDRWVADRHEWVAINESANIAVMFKKGQTRMPAYKVVPFSFAVGQEPGPLLRRWLDAYLSQVRPHIAEYLARPVFTGILTVWRKALQPHMTFFAV